MNILITGGAGFIGSALSRKMVEAGHNITILDNLSVQIHGEDPLNSSLVKSLPESIKLLVGDVRDKDCLRKALVDQDVVVHLAAETGTGQSMYEIDRYVDINIRGTSLILDLIEKERFSVKKFVVASSRAIYGEGKYQGAEGYVYPGARKSQDMDLGMFDCRSPVTNEFVKSVPTDENSAIHPTSIYGITKQVQEQLVLTACESIGISAVSLRYQNVYGPGQSLKNPYTGILSIFSGLLLKNKDINVFEDGEESRDFVFIDDVVDATERAITSSVSGHAYNVGSGVKTTVIKVAEILKQSYGSKSNISISGNYRVGDIRHNTADLAKIKRDLGFVPRVSFENGVKQFADWVKQQEVCESGYEKSIQEMRERGMFK